MPYISNTDKERKEMLQEIGVNTFEDLLSNIPCKYRLDHDLDLDRPLAELEISKKVNRLAERNTSTCKVNSFLGGGIYDHYIPAAVDHIILRPEFHTAYTPYQAEVSQGTLQHIYEFQTLICELTGMEIANASMYDGGSSAAEAILMSMRKNRKNKILISETINPAYLKVIRNYLEGLNPEIIMIGQKEGVTDLNGLKHALDNNVSCVLIQTPNFFGCIEPVFEIEEIIHSLKNVLFITAVDPISLGVLNSPAEYNADIVVGEGQALGNPQFYGGPLLGFFATKMSLARQMPGRIVGATVDAQGKRAYSLTLQAREQHIRREKATSNICSNQSLCALAATVYMCLMGREGLTQVAEQSATKAQYLANEISSLNGFSLAYKAPFFKEFVVLTPLAPSEIIAKLQKKNIFAGIDLTESGYDNQLMIAVTEKKSKNDLDVFVQALKEVSNG